MSSCGICDTLPPSPLSLKQCVFKIVHYTISSGVSADVTLLGSDVQVEAEYVPSPLVLTYTSETHC